MRWLLIFALAGGLACGSPATVPVGSMDASTSSDAGDGGRADAGDAGDETDAGTDAGEDAGASDGGAFDAGSSDGGLADGGDGGTISTSAPGIPCLDTIDDVYITPAGLPAMTPANRGDIVRCAVDVALSTADVNTQLSGKGVIGVTAVNGASSYRIAYRTTRANGVDGVGTARVFLPTVARSTLLPIIVSAHGSDGLAATCAPSKDPTGNAELSMPFAGNGYAVIAPDYAGLGNEGAQAYLDNLDTGHSVLDAARALRKLIPGAFSSQIALVGFSQGGGAVLSGQALAGTYGADGDVIGVVVMAAQWQTRLNSFGYIDALNSPGELTIETGVAKPPIYVMRQYGYQYNQLGPGTIGAGFPSAKADALVSAVQSDCLVVLGGVVQGDGPYLRDLVDPTLSAGVLACVAGQASAGCTGSGQALYQYLTNNILTGDPAGAPIVYIQGLADIIMPPAQEAACNIEKLNADGVYPQICIDAPAQHTNLIERNVAFALEWVGAALAGTAAPTCTSSGMPACTP